MRSTHNSKVHFTKSGNIAAISLGSDFCSEHECGIAPLFESLCGDFKSKKDVSFELRKQICHLDTKDAIKLLNSDKLNFQYLNMIESRHITKFPQGLSFHKSECGKHAELAYSNRTITRQYEKPTLKQTVFCAWDSDSFSIKVSDQKQIKAFEKFYDGLLKGKVCFGGKFFEKNHKGVSGFTLVDTRYITDDDRKEILKVQEDYISEVQITALSEVDLIQAHIRNSNTAGLLYSYIWPVWNDNKTDLLYAINPVCDAKVDYFGPYTREQLYHWIMHKCSYHLAPSSTKTLPWPHSKKGTLKKVANVLRIALA